MLYIPDSGGVLAQDEVVILDSETNELKLEAPWNQFWPELGRQHIVPQSVVGLFRKESTLLITPVSKIEIKVMALLHNPHFFVRDTLGDGGAGAYGSYGLYNFTDTTSKWQTPDESYSVAKLLLENCGEAKDEISGNARIETTRNYIAICVDNTKFQSTYLRFDIEDYDRVTRAFVKYKMLKRREGQMSFHMTVSEES